MHNSLKVILSVVLIIVAATWVVLPIRFDVQAPRLGIPAIVTNSESVDVEINYSLPFMKPDWQARLVQGDKKIPVQLTQQQDKSSAIAALHKHHLSFSIPADLDAGAYELVVTNGNVEQRRPKAVHVVEGYPEQITLIQLADLPEFGDHGDGDQRMQTIIGEVNLINPDLILLTGDVAYGGSWDQYERLLKAIENFNAPVIAVPGNHEYEGWAGYLTTLGKPFHTVDYGPYRIVSLNSGHGRDQLTESQYHWLTTQFAQLNQQIPIVQIHHPLFRKPDWRGYVGNHVNDMAQLFKQHNVPIVLSGHWHGDSVYDDTGQYRDDTWQFPGIPYVVTTTAGKDLRQKYSASPLHHGYRLVRIKGKQLLNYTYDMDGDGERDPTASIPIGHLHVSANEVDVNGNQSIVVKNDLNESFSKAKVSFVVGSDDKVLMPSVGEITKRYRANDETIYEVQFVLPAKTTQTISLIDDVKQE